MVDHGRRHFKYHFLQRKYLQLWTQILITKILFWAMALHQNGLKVLHKLLVTVMKTRKIPFMGFPVPKCHGKYRSTRLKVRSICKWSFPARQGNLRICAGNDAWRMFWVMWLVCWTRVNFTNRRVFHSKFIVDGNSFASIPSLAIRSLQILHMPQQHSSRAIGKIRKRFFVD